MGCVKLQLPTPSIRVRPSHDLDANVDMVHRDYIYTYNLHLQNPTLYMFMTNDYFTLT